MDIIDWEKKIIHSMDMELDLIMVEWRDMKWKEVEQIQRQEAYVGLKKNVLRVAGRVLEGSGSSLPAT